MRPARKFPILLLALLLAGCAVPGVAPQSIPAAALRAGPTPIAQLPGATITPTPFQPLPPTPTAAPETAAETQPERPRKEKKAKPHDFAPPSEYSDVPIPPPANPIREPDGQTTILVLGSDQREGESIYRTDTILLVALNPKKQTVNMVSFPRDLYVYIPGWTMQRINTAYAHGGFETIAQTLEYNFGVRPDHYVVVDFNFFLQLVDSLGGIDVEVEKPLADNHDQYGWYSVQPGTVHMNGLVALWYVRSRFTTSDFDRNRRQQAVVRALIEHMLSINAIARAPKLYRTYADNVTTDLSLKDTLSLLPFAAKIRDLDQINQYFIDRSLVTEWISPGGAMVLLPHQEATSDLMQQALNSRD
jgi:LCP family protein required for cell wall assembly